MSSTESAEKKRKQGKGAASYNTKYDKEWESKFPISNVNGNPHAFYCIPCAKVLSCGHQGMKDVTDHCDGNTHVLWKRSKIVVTYVT